MRTFMAIDIDKKLEDKISKVQMQLMEADAPVKFVEPENLHLTFKFFGNIIEEKIKEIIALSDDKVKKYSPFELSMRGLGVFPNLGYIRVLWIGLVDPEPFSRMQMDFDEDFVKMGFKKERSYIPHLTIGRVKGARNKDALVSKIKELEDVEIGDMNVNKLILKKSELTPSGPIYTTLKEFNLKIP